MIAVLALALSLPVLQVPTAESALDDLLFVAGMSRADLHAEEPLRSGNRLAVALHAEPLRAAVEIPTQLARLAEGRSAEALAFGRSVLDPDPALPSGSRSNAEIEPPRELPEAVRQVVIRLGRYVAEANDEVRHAISGLTAEERRDLIEGLPRHAVDPSLLTLDFVNRPMPTWPTLRALMKKVDLPRLRQAAERLADQVEGEIALAWLAPSFSGKYKFFSGGLTIVVAGKENDVHDDRDAQLTVDFGGNDHYTGRHGAGIGYASICLDLKGDDAYHVPDLSLGAGLLGIGMAWDVGGSDGVQTGSLALGSGVAGVGFFSSTGPPSRHGLDASPNGADSFRSETMAQGFGLNGIGVFRRKGGDDHYRLRYLGQGSGLTEGVGLFLAQFGGETIVASGLAPSLESDDVLRSRSQGFGGRIGWASEEPGGTGILIASSNGHRWLSAGTEAQGCGLDGGVGILIEPLGSSTRRISGYGQGFGARQGVGLVFTSGSGSAFIARNPAQGCGVESGIGLLIGGPGDDLYDLGGGGFGVSATGGLGLFWDTGGVDRYGGFFLSGRHDLRSLDFRLDVGSESVGLVPLGTNRIDASRGRRSMGWFSDLARSSVGEGGPATPASGPLVGVDAIERALREASGLAPYAGRAIRLSARRALEADPLATVRAVVRIASARPLADAEAETIGALASASDAAARELAALVAHADAGVARAALEAIRAGRIMGAAAAVRSALERKETTAAAARTAAALDLKEASGELMLLCASSDSEVRREAIASLSELGGQEALATAQALLGHLDPVVRLAAARLIGRLGMPDLTPLRTLAENADEATARAAIRALGGIGSTEALRFLGALLESPKVAVRLQALIELNGRCPSEFRGRIDARRNDADRRVRLVANGIDPGR